MEADPALRPHAAPARPLRGPAAHTCALVHARGVALGTAGVLKFISLQQNVAIRALYRWVLEKIASFHFQWF